MKKAFTLIELLIVIAIIAILALIAVPNFLEAQVRAKVSRVHADMRTAATAIEAYSVDWGTPPPGVQERQNNLGDPRNGPTLRVVVWMPLTTPVAFMSSMIYDPFLQREDDDSRQNYTYNTFVVLDNGSTARKAAYEGSYTRGFTWGLSCFGPARDSIAGGNGMPYVLSATNTAGGPGSFIYDASNGTMSFGMIIRTNKGVYTQAQ